MPIYGTATQGFFQGLDAALARQQMLKDIKDREMAQSQAGDALRQLFSQAGPPPGTPQPGTQSQPAIPPVNPQMLQQLMGGQGQPPADTPSFNFTQGGRPGAAQMNPQQILQQIMGAPMQGRAERMQPQNQQEILQALLRSPLGAQLAGPQIPPYRNPAQAAGGPQAGPPMQQPMQPAGQPAGMPPPPAMPAQGAAKREISIDAAGRILAGQGLSGASFLQALNTMAPILDAEGKRQLAEANAALRSSQAETARLRADEVARHNAALEPSLVEQRAARSDSSTANAELNRARIEGRGYAPQRGSGTGGRTPTLGNINSFLGRQAKELAPITKVQEATQELRGLLETDNPAATPQIQKLLTDYVGHIRMTNHLYADNKSFGGAYKRLQNALNRWYEGDYSADNKKLILGMVNEMDKTVFEPARQNIVRKNKSVLSKLGADPSLAEDPNPYGASDTPAAGGGIPEGWSVKEH